MAGLLIAGALGYRQLPVSALPQVDYPTIQIVTFYPGASPVVMATAVTAPLERQLGQLPGMQPLAAALRGAQEIGFTVISISLSLVAVFIPILLMGGIVGRLFREFAVTLSVAIAVSLLVSLTTTPMMCALLLRPRGEARHGRLYRASERAFGWILGRYEKSLSWVLGHQPLMILVTLATMATTVFLYVAVPKGFFPQQDTGRLNGSIQADQDTSFQAMQPKLAQFVATVMQDPAVESVNGFLGGGSFNTARMFVGLKAREDRDVTADQVIRTIARTDRARPRRDALPAAGSGRSRSCSGSSTRA
jgi:multidrug efflux pump